MTEWQERTSGGGAWDDAGRVHLRILATSDLHMQLMPFDYHADRSDPGAGLAALVPLIESARAEVSNALLVDNGDLVQGGPMGDIAASRIARGLPQTHPAIAAMNLLNYDAATLGNHDFNYGLETQGGVYAEAAFPIVLSNAVPLAGTEVVFRRNALLDRQVIDAAGARHRLRIGIVGFCPPQVLRWDRAHLKGRLHVEPILDAAAREVPALRAAGADIVVALAHSGLGTDAMPGSRSWGEHVSRALAALPGIDAVVAGHDHVPHPQEDAPDAAPANGRAEAEAPLVNPAAFGTRLGVIDLHLRRGTDGWRRVYGRAHLRRPEAARAVEGGLRARLEAALEDDHACTRAAMRRTVCSLPGPLHSYFAAAGDTLVTSLVAAAFRKAVAPVLDTAPHRDLPLVVSATVYRAGGHGGPANYIDVRGDRLLARHVEALYPFANAIALHMVTGRDLRAWLERSMSVFATVQPGARDAPLLDPRFAPYDLDVLHGLTWQVDLSAPARHGPDGAVIAPRAARVLDLRAHGRYVACDDRFLLLANSYRAAGSGGFPDLSSESTVRQVTDSAPALLAQSLAAHGVDDLRSEPPFGFAPLGDTTALLCTGPGAHAYRGDAQALGLEEAGEGPDGFVLFRLRL